MVAKELVAGDISTMMAQSVHAAGRIEFETVSDSPDWRIPAVGQTTRIALGLRITNGSLTSLRFTNFDTLRPAMRNRNGQALAYDGGRNRTLLPDVDNCPLLAPGASILFSLDATLYWQEGVLRLGGSDGYGGFWYFSGIEPGRYEFRIAYAQQRDHLVLGTAAARALRPFWVGEAAGSAITVTIAHP